jgi:hypothetical protein
LITNFINSVYKQLTDSNARYYYLLETSKSTVRWDNQDLNLSDELKDFPNIKGIPVNELQEAMATDTIIVNWHNYNLINAKVTAKEHLPQGYSSVKIFRIMPVGTPDSIIEEFAKKGQTVILVKPGLSKRRRKEAISRAEQPLENRPLEETEWYAFSKPVFSKDQGYALISVEYSAGGGTFIFKRAGLNWTEVVELNRFAY